MLSYEIDVKNGSDTRVIYSQKENVSVDNLIPGQMVQLQVSSVLSNQRSLPSKVVRHWTSNIIIFMHRFDNLVFCFSF